MSMLKCPRCGALVEVSAAVTPRCGTCDFPEPDARPAQRPAARLTPPVAERPKRPLGVAILAGLGLLGGTLAGGLGALLMLGSPLLAEYRPQGAIGAYASALGVAFGIVLAALGALHFIVALGLWRGRGWAWTLEMVQLTLYAVVGVRGLLIGANTRVGHLLVTCSLAWYFFTPGVRALFGRAQPATS
jgi:hypothetical protein